jgi:hypothetical protein
MASLRLPNLVTIEQRHFLLSKGTHPDADANRTAREAIRLASGCWGSKTQTTVTSNRRFSGVQKVVVFFGEGSVPTIMKLGLLLAERQRRSADSLSLKVDTHLYAVGDLDKGNAAFHPVFLPVESHRPRNRARPSPFAGNR